ncbi:MAG: hypothetical protein ACYTEE_11010, partial [Planctomycetota bacterium]
MNRSNIIKEYFYDNVKQFDLRANNKSDIRVCTYAVNKEEYGTINFFISDNAGFKYLLKKSRSELVDTRHRLRIAELNKMLIDEKYDCLRPYMIIGQEVEIFGDGFLLYEFIKCSNFYRLIRSNLARTNILALLDIAFEFCHLLEKSSTMTELIGDEVEQIFETFCSAYGDSKEMMSFVMAFRDQITDI